MPAAARVLDANLAYLAQHYPDLRRAVEADRDKHLLHVFQAQQGGLAYALRHGDKLTPLTDPVRPLQRIQEQVNAQAAQLMDFTRPVLIVGCYPGQEILTIFNNCEQASGPHCPQPLWIGIDSIPCLYGFLTSCDARALIASPRTHFFLAQDAVGQVDWLCAHPAFPHIFTLISGAGDTVLGQVLTPLIQLTNARDAETRRLVQENAAYYAAQSDRDLRALLMQQADRPPRIMMPTCAWSTYIQYSTRDTLQAFEHLGWDTLELKTDAMLTPWHLVSSIHRFKPDLFLFIDHLRHEALPLYPPNMLFVTWVQDEMDHLLNDQAAAAFRELTRERCRDFIAGYAGDELVNRYRYPADRFFHLLIPAKTAQTRAATIDTGQTDDLACEVAFMSNVSRPTDRIMEETILPKATLWGLPRAACEAIHDHLWNQYRTGRTFSDRGLFLREMMQFNDWAEVYLGLRSNDLNLLPGDLADNLFRLFYWRLNDVIYRQVVLEWIDEAGLDLHLYGQGWDAHPRFARYARSPLRHGDELFRGYRAARCNLHLNITSGTHQRIMEIIAADAHLLMRVGENRDSMRREAAILKGMLPLLYEDGRFDSLHRNSDRFLYNLMASMKNHLPNESDPIGFLREHIRWMIISRPDVMIPDFEARSFRTREELLWALAHVPADKQASYRHYVALDYRYVAKTLVRQVQRWLAADAATTDSRDDDRLSSMLRDLMAPALAGDASLLEQRAEQVSRPLFLRLMNDNFAACDKPRLWESLDAYVQSAPLTGMDKERAVLLYTRKGAAEQALRLAGHASGDDLPGRNCRLMVDWLLGADTGLPQDPAHLPDKSLVHDLVVHYGSANARHTVTCWIERICTHRNDFAPRDVLRFLTWGMDVFLYTDDSRRAASWLCQAMEDWVPSWKTTAEEQVLLGTMQAFTGEHEKAIKALSAKAYDPASLFRKAVWLPHCLICRWELNQTARFLRTPTFRNLRYPFNALKALMMDLATGATVCADQVEPLALAVRENDHNGQARLAFLFRELGLPQRALAYRCEQGRLFWVLNMALTLRQTGAQDEAQRLVDNVAQKHGIDIRTAPDTAQAQAYSSWTMFGSPFVPYSHVLFQYLYARWQDPETALAPLLQNWFQQYSELWP